MFLELPARLLNHLLIYRFLDHPLYLHHQFLHGTLHHRNQLELALRSLVQCEAKSDLELRLDITNPEEWSAGDTAILRNQEAKKVREFGL